MTLLEAPKGASINMELPPLVRVTRREAKALLATGSWKQDHELTQASGGDSYKGPSGQGLIFLPGRMGADICDDRDAILAYFLAVRAQPPEHMLKGIFLRGESFPAEVPKLIDQLAEDTGLKRSALDGSEESLLRVERAFSRKGGRRAFLRAERFPAVVAYAGEVLRHRLGGGTWEMELSHGQWEPWIVGEDGSRYPIFILVHDGLEQRRAGAILALLQGELFGQFLIRSSTRKGGSD